MTATQGEIYAIGIQPEGVEYGNMAVMNDGDFSSIKFTADDLSEDGTTDAQWITSPELLQAPGDFDGPDGNGEEWGQSFEGKNWNIWSYNDSTPDVEDWAPGSYTAMWVEYNLDQNLWMGFKNKIEIAVGATSLTVQTTATFLLLLI